MNTQVRLDQALRIVGTNDKGHETTFDTSFKGGGLDSAASPMEVVLEAVGACMTMDVVSILRKQHKAVSEFTVRLTAERALTEPKVFTKIAMEISLVSNDATMEHLLRAVQLSQLKYCSVSSMLTRGGCEITWTASLTKIPEGNASPEHDISVTPSSLIN